MGLGLADMTGKMAGAYIGQSLERVEDRALLTGRGRYADDLPVAAGTLHAAILRSPYAHAEILAIDTARALAMPGVNCVVTGDDVRRLTRPFIAAVKSAIEHWCLAIEPVRYQGEPVAVVVAGDRYRAEDALEAIDVTYRPLPAMLDPTAAAGPDVVSDRYFRYGDPEAAFAAAPHCYHRGLSTQRLRAGQDAWSIAAGNYSSRFADAVAGAAHLAAVRLRDKLTRSAAAQLNVPPDAVRFADGRIFAAGNPDHAIAVARLAGTSHWSPGSLPGPDGTALHETVFWTPPGLDAPNNAGEITPLRAKGVGEGNSMSTPVCLANALGVADLALPLTPSRVAALLPSASP